MHPIRIMTLYALLLTVWLYTSLFPENRSVCAKSDVITVSEASSETFCETAAPAGPEDEGTVIPRFIEDYVTGVVAAEMPPYFPEEALKAQAVAARTYACREYAADPDVDIYSIGQAYITEAKMRSLWGDDYGKYRQKAADAVTATEGEILVYQNEPILAAFCSASGGMTENSENVWGAALPYLRSVDSAVDKQAPVYQSSLSLAPADLAARLGVPYAQDIAVTERTSAGYVLKVSAGGRSMDGDTVRQRLGLRSADFEIGKTGGEIVFTVRGYGHGVGMSQYGAKYMAENGCGYMDILKHYYTGVELKKCGVE